MSHGNEHLQKPKNGAIDGSGLGSAHGDQAAHQTMTWTFNLLEIG
jgi:hypothetical protein